ncbi:MAG: hypothetical protein ACKOW3_06420 [Hyphomicrobium sp.]
MATEENRCLSSSAKYSLLCLLLLLTGCATGEQAASALSSGETCQSVRGKLDRLLSNGAQWKVEAVSAGRKLSAADKADADSYNRLLNEYLGAKCHVQ